MGSNPHNAMHDEVSLLLPWYVNGTLSTPERKKVQAHLDACAECREEAALCEDMMASVQQQGPTPILPATTAAQVLDGAQNIVASETQWSRYQRWGIAAGLGLLALLVVTTMAPDESTDAENQRFETATSRVALETVDYVLELQFADDVSLDERLVIIGELGGSDPVMAAEQSRVKIVVSLLPKSLDELEQRAAEIEARHEIESAEFVALQLPMR